MEKKVEMIDLINRLKNLDTQANIDKDSKNWGTYNTLIEEYNNVRIELELLLPQLGMPSIQTVTYEQRGSVTHGGPPITGMGTIDEKVKYSEIIAKTKNSIYELEEIMMSTDKKKSTQETVPNSKKVFVVHGKDEMAKHSMFDFLRAIGLEPIEWSQAIRFTEKAAPFIGEILEAAFGKAQAVVVLFTGDEEVKLRDKYIEHGTTGVLEHQARPNVLFEAGIAVGRCPDRTILVELGNLRQFSDITGRHAVKLDNSTEKRQELAMKLQNAKCNVNLEGTDWHRVGNFDVDE